MSQARAATVSEIWSFNALFQQDAYFENPYIFGPKVADPTAPRDGPYGALSVGQSYAGELRFDWEDNGLARTYKTMSLDIGGVVRSESNVTVDASTALSLTGPDISSHIFWSFSSLTEIAFNGDTGELIYTNDWMPYHNEAVFLFEDVSYFRSDQAPIALFSASSVNLASMPVPASLSLLLAGMGGLAWMKRRRRE